MYKEEKDKYAQESILGNQHKQNFVWSILVKYKDPGCPTVSCTIGQTEISRALLDLGTSINLLPPSVYQQLGLGELSPTRVTIQLADRSVKILKGEITDVLIQVGDFIYPVDFLVLETQPVLNPQSKRLQSS